MRRMLEVSLARHEQRVKSCHSWVGIWWLVVLVWADPVGEAGWH